jgi:hypothetical protein
MTAPEELRPDAVPDPTARVDDLLERALLEDARYWEEHHRPISAETLHKQLHIGAARLPELVPAVRSERRTASTSR